MNPRASILTAIRAGLGTPRAAPEFIAVEAAGLLDAPDTTRPRLAAPTLSEAFAIKVQALGATVDRIASMDAVPRAVRRYIDAQGVPPAIALQPAPAFARLDWSSLLTHTDLAADELAAVGLARWGVAESGSLIVHSDPVTPILLSFLPLHHIVVLRESDVVPYLEDYAGRLARGVHPRNAVLITGPSGTTDIEGSYVRGAHGPGFLHIIMVTDPS